MSRPRINSSEIKEMVSGSPVEQKEAEGRKLSRIYKGSLKIRQPNFNEASCDSSVTTESLKNGFDLDAGKSFPRPPVRQENPEESHWSFEDDLFANGDLLSEEVSK